MAARQRILEQNGGLGSLQIDQSNKNGNSNGHHELNNSPSIATNSITTASNGHGNHTTTTAIINSTSTSSVLGGGGYSSGVSFVFLFCFILYDFH